MFIKFGVSQLVQGRKSGIILIYGCDGLIENASIGMPRKRGEELGDLIEAPFDCPGGTSNREACWRKVKVKTNTRLEAMSTLNRICARERLLP